MDKNRVAILCTENAAVFELGCAIELFAIKRPEYSDWYQTDIITLDEGLVQTSIGLKVQAKKVRSLKGYDTLIVPSWPTKNTLVSKRLRKQTLGLYDRGGRVIAFCSGAFFLAELGLLLNRDATTHWRYEKLFKQTFPDVRYVENVLYVFDGRIGCSAGSAAALDLGIEVIRHDHGYEVANAVARRLVLPAQRKGGQAQFVQTPVSKNNNHFSSTLDWAVKNLHKEIDIDLLARKTNLSRRSFDRHFRATLGMSPKEWLSMQRLHQAQSLLENKQFKIERIAELSGFQNAMNLRHYFRKYLGISPSEYRNQFLNA